MSELPRRVHDEIARLSERGDLLAEAGNYNAAVGRYREALALLPTPNNEHDAALWLYAAIGDAYFAKGDFEACRQNMLLAAADVGGSENPFVQLRLGQASLELGRRDDAYRHLMLAFRIGGERLFAAQDAKYLAWLRERVVAQG